MMISGTLRNLECGCYLVSSGCGCPKLNPRERLEARRKEIIQAISKLESEKNEIDTQIDKIEQSNDY